MENKMISQRIDTFMAYAASLPGAKSYYREDWDTNYFELQGKQFGMMSIDGTAESIVTLKNDPEKNEELREMYPEVIIPGYYANKKHWNSIKLASEALSDDEIKHLIKVSYQLVLAKLPKKTRELLAAEEN